MTGREFIIYILENHLEDEDIFDKKNLMTEEEAADKFDVGVATIRAFIELGAIPGIKIGHDIYIPKEVKNPKNKFEKDRGLNYV